MEEIRRLRRVAAKAGAQGDESEGACLSIAVDILPDDTTRNCQRCYRYAAIASPPRVAALTATLSNSPVSGASRYEPAGRM